MIREKYQYSGFTSIVGNAVVSDVPLAKARFSKKGYHGSDGPFVAGGDASLRKARQLEPSVYTDPSIAVSQVHVRRDRFFDAERDHIKRFQRGDYDGDFPLRSRDAETDSGGLESILKALGNGGMAKRRKSFIFAPKVANLFDENNEPIFDAAFQEGLGEGQSRQVLREMEKRHRRQREAFESWDAARRLMEAEVLMQQKKKEEEDELQRLKEKMRKSHKVLESFKDDVSGEEDFQAQMDRIKRLLGKGRGFGGDTMGDEFMSEGGDQHRALVEEYNRLSGGKGNKQRLYNALHYGSAVDSSEMPMIVAKDNHFVCPCCGEHHTNGATKAHDPSHIQEAELRSLSLQHRKRTNMAASGPTRSAGDMATVSNETRVMEELKEEIEARKRERNVFKVQKTDEELLHEKCELILEAEELIRSIDAKHGIEYSPPPPVVALSSSPPRMPLNDGMSLAKAKSHPAALTTSTMGDAADPILSLPLYADEYLAQTAPALTPLESAEANDHIDTLLAVAEEEAKGNAPGLTVRDRASAVEATQIKARHKAFLAANPDFKQPKQPTPQPQPLDTTSMLLVGTNNTRDLKLSVVTTSISAKSIPGKQARGRGIVLNTF